MKIVSLEWFEQSIERGMVLDERLYNPTMPVEQRGEGAWDRKLPSLALGKRIRNAEQAPSLNSFRRKLRRSASTKMGSQSEALWAGITAASLDRQQEDEDDWTEDSVAKQDTAQVISPATRVGKASDESNDAQRSVCTTDDRVPPLPLPLDDSSHGGIFEGRLVLPYGFDAEKACQLSIGFWIMLTSPSDKDLVRAPRQPWCTRRW